MLGIDKLDKVPGFHKYKPLLLFVVKALALFFGFLIIKIVHKFLIDPSVNLPFSNYLRNVDVYSLMANAIIYPSKYLLSSIGYETVLGNRTIAIVGHRGVEIQGPCMGFDVFSVFIALIIAYPSRTTNFQKALFIVAGVLAIHILNVLRVSALLLKHTYSIKLPINHHDLFNIVIYIFVFASFYFWTKYYSKSTVALS
jgi:exosortase/archaeosortase family protein